MFRLFIGALTLILSSVAFANIVTLDDGSRVAIDVQRGSGADTYVLVNGLVYETARWDAVANGLHDDGATVVRYALLGQPENLRLLRQGEEPAFFAGGFELADLVHQLEQVLHAAHVAGRVHIVGLSYGASVAAAFSQAHPERVAETTFIAPLVVPLDAYDAGGAALRAWLDGVRFWEEAPCAIYGAVNPFLCVGKDAYYDALYTSIYQTYLFDRISDVPEDIDPTLYKKSIFHLVRAVRDFDLKQIIGSLHHVSMLVADGEDATLAADQKAAWSLVPAADRLRFETFAGTKHALPDESPDQVVEALEAISAH